MESIAGTGQQLLATHFKQLIILFVLFFLIFYILYSYYILSIVPVAAMFNFPMQDK